MKLRYTFSVDMDVPGDDAYDTVTPEEALAAGVELPVNTSEKKAAVEKIFFAMGMYDIADMIGNAERECVQVNVEVIDVEESAS